MKAPNNLLLQQEELGYNQGRDRFIANEEFLMLCDISG